MIGKTVSHYKIIEELGRGGMGVVYKAEDLRLKRVVVLKFLAAELTRDDSAKARLVHEAQAASALQHHNICTIHVIDQNPDGRMFICMDYYPGDTLSARLEKGPLPLGDALDIAAQTAAGLAKAHEAGIVHRDVKSANIAVTPDGVVKILDFGIAMLSDRTRLTRAGGTVGTVAYMSPEQSRGDEVTPASDVWSLGVILYEMLTGRVPFAAEHEAATLYSIIYQPHQPVVELRGDVPAGLSQIVDKALAKDPGERYGGAGEMARDLRAAAKEVEAAKDFEASESEQRLSGRLGREKQIRSARGRRARIWVPLAIVATLALVFFVVKPLFLAEELVSAPHPIAVISFENRTGDAEYDYLREVIPNLLITSLEQSKYLSVVTWERMHDLVRQTGRVDRDIIDADTGFEICRLDGIDTIVLGSFTKAGDVFATDVKVLDVNSKKLIRSASAKGDGVGSILETQIDDLGSKISQGIGLSQRSIDAAGTRPIASVTTGSMEAYDDFLRGRDASQKYYYDDARRYLERAVGIDSTFAVAWSYLGNAYWQLRNPKAGTAAYEKAMALSSQAPEKDRLWIEAMYAEMIKHDREEFGLRLKELVARYPKEKTAFVQLGIYYRDKHLYDEAEDALGKALDLDPVYGEALNSLAYNYAAKKDYQTAIEYFKRYAAAYPGDANPHDSMAEIYFRMGDLDRAIESYRDALAIKPDFGSNRPLAYIYGFEEDYPRAIETLETYIAKAPSPGLEAGGRYIQAFLYTFACGWPKALSTIDAARETWDEIGFTFGASGARWLEAWVRCLKGDYARSRECIKESVALARETHQATPYLVFISEIVMGRNDLKEGNTEGARSHLQAADSLLTRVFDSEPKHADMARYNTALFRAEILLADGEVDSAITTARSTPHVDIPNMGETSIFFYNYPTERDVLARAYARKGERDKAIYEYERLLAIDPAGGDRRLKYALFHYRLARLYEADGRPDKAAAQYEKFLNICGHVEPAFDELTDARDRLEQLSAHTP
ncbi:MAG: protein kinase [bacterium]